MATITGMFNLLKAEIAHTASNANAAGIRASEAQGAWIAASEEAKAAQTQLDDLRAEWSSLEETARRLGLDAEIPSLTDGVIPAVDDRDDGAWTTLSRLGAVEKIVYESGAVPLHIKDIVARLAEHGREGDTYALVSASLATLRTRRGTVEKLGGGRWVHTEFLPAQQTAARQAAERDPRVAAFVLPEELEVHRD